MGSSASDNSASLPRLSLVGSLRIGGFVLLLGFLANVAAYLALEKGEVGPASDRVYATQDLARACERTRGAILDEWLARFGAATAGTDPQAASSVTDAQLTRLRRAVSHAGLEEPLRVPIDGLESAVAAWRNEPPGREPAQAEASLRTIQQLFAVLSVEGERALASRIVELESARESRLWVLLVFGLVGGLASLIATAAAVRHARHSLHRIASHVSAIERGVLASRPIDQFREFSEVNLRLNALGMALEAARAESTQERESARARQSDLELAQELVLEFTRARNEGEVVDAFCRRAPPAVGAARVEVLRLVMPESFLEEISVEADRKNPLRVVEGPEACRAYRTASGGVSLSGAGRSAITASCPAKPACEAVLLCIPMVTTSGPIGTVHYFAAPGSEGIELRRPLAEMLVGLLAPALENVRLLRESVERSSTDALTGLANRRRLEEFGTKQLALAMRQGAPFAVVALDIDRFKTINDTYGHEGGDRALSAVASALRGALRETDLAARLGGDEFALLLPGSTAAAAVSVVERVRATLSKSRGTRLPVRIGVSAGVAELSNGARSLAELLALADRALYGAKRRRGSTRAAAPLKSDAGAVEKGAPEVADDDEDA